MRNIYLLILLLGIAFGCSLIFYFHGTELSDAEGTYWLHKDKEIKSRFRSIPILLYHNIDGNGAFSVDLAQIRLHFELIRDRGIKVIPLDELIKRLDKPVPFDDRAMVITFDDGYRSMLDKLLPLAREFGFPVTLFVYTDFVRKHSSRNLSWDDVRTLDAGGIDIECHTQDHQRLVLTSVMDDPESRRRLYEEIYLSKRIIELYLDREVRFFAFPYGQYDLKIVDLCQKAGYERVFSTDDGSNIITRDNYSLRRQHIKHNYSIQFIDRLIR